MADLQSRLLGFQPLVGGPNSCSGGWPFAAFDFLAHFSETNVRGRLRLGKALRGTYSEREVWGRGLLRLGKALLSKGKAISLFFFPDACERTVEASRGAKESLLRSSQSNVIRISRRS